MAEVEAEAEEVDGGEEEEAAEPKKKIGRPVGSKTYSAGDKEYAKKLYFRGHSVLEVCKLSGISRGRLLNWINGKTLEENWMLERRQYYKHMMAEAVKDSGVNKFGNILEIGLELLYEHFKRMQANSEKNLSVKDMKLISDLITNVDRIIRLEKGKPTQHGVMEVKRSHDELIEETKKELEALLDNDPMATDGENDRGLSTISKSTAIN